MCCITWTGLEATMATTQLTRAAGLKLFWPAREEQKTESNAPRLNWVVVTDENGRRELRMEWQAAARDF